MAPSGTTLYVNAFGVSAELFGGGTGAAQWTDYLAVGNVKVGMRVTNIAAQTVSTRYFHTDHLGSISVITDENGVVLQRLSYDAWGKRRFSNGADDPTGSITSQTSRGFTGQEELDSVALVHLNGRVYDPMVGRMISADPTVTDPTNPQGWNRYSYVGNDPLAFTDPSGFSWLSSFFHSVSNAISGVWHSVTHFFATNAIARAILQIGLNFILSPLGPVAAAAISAAVVAGLSGGNLGQMLRAGAIAGATAFAFNEVGDLTQHTPSFGTPAYAENVVGHALVGCASSAASGGSCQSGALSGAVGSALSPVTNVLFPDARTDIGERIGGTIMEATAGGVASVAGGGKFANGAVTAAFGYQFNQMGEDEETRGRGLIPETPEEVSREVREELDPNIRGGLDYTPARDPNQCYPDDPLSSSSSSRWDTSGGLKGINTDVTADSFSTNLQLNGYTARTVMGSNGPVTVLENGQGSTYTVYTRSSTGLSGAQYSGANGQYNKYNLGR